MMYSLESKIYDFDLSVEHFFLKKMLRLDYHLIMDSQIYPVPFTPKVTKMNYGSQSFDYDQIIPQAVITRG